MYIIKKNINWVITGWLSLGSVPAALTLWILHSIKQILPLNSIIKYSLGWALLLTSVAVFKKTINYIAKTCWR
jgi:hypothetical protein